MIPSSHDFFTGLVGAGGVLAAIGFPFVAWVAKALPIIQAISGIVGICVGLTTMVLLIERRVRKGPPQPEPPALHRRSRDDDHERDS